MLPMISVLAAKVQLPTRSSLQARSALLQVRSQDEAVETRG